MRKLSASLLASAVVLSLVLTACAPAPTVEPTKAVAVATAQAPTKAPEVTSAPAPTAKPPATPVPEKKKLVWTYGMGTNCLDPAFQTGQPDSLNMLNIYSSLVKHKPGTLTEVNPDLAEKWEISPDGMVYTFHLRPGVIKWQGGYGELTAQDIKYSWDRIKDPTTKATSGVALTPVDKVEVVDPKTVRVTLKYPYPAFIINIAHAPETAIVNKRAIEERGKEYCLKPIGTGPYEVVKAETGGTVVLQAFDGYFGGQPAIGEVEMRVLPEENVAVLALKSGQVDMVIAREAASIAELSKDKNLFFNANDKDSTSIYGLFLNVTRKPLDDVRVRQAMMYALDRETLVREASEGLVSTPAYTVVPPSLLGHTTDVQKYEYNPGKAKQLLADAGYPNGIKVTVESMKISYHPVVLTMVQSMWKQVGIDLKIEFMERAAFREHQATGNYDICVAEVNRAEVDAIMDRFRCGKLPNGVNLSLYAGPCDLVEQQARELDPKKRVEMLQAIQRRIAEDVPIVPLWHTPNVSVAPKYVKGLVPNLGIYQTLFYLFDIQK